MGQYQRNADIIANLSDEQFWVTQQNGTERPGSGKLLRNKAAGIYVDIVSGEPLFASSDKYESGCGWPSFTKPIEASHITEISDDSHGMVRTEVRSTPNGIRTRAATLKGWCPRPLDDGGLSRRDLVSLRARRI